MNLVLVASAILANHHLAPPKDFTLTVLHTNDLHAHAEGATISKQPYGGYARHITLINQFRKSDPNTILLNAGDTFQGTLYFTQYQGLADLIYMNYAKYDAMTLGNHEFDKGPEGIAKFVENAQFPILSANLDVEREPLLKGKIAPSTVLMVGKEKVGVIGVMTNELPFISFPGPNVKLKDMIASVQTEIDAMQAKGINKIIALTHIGIDEDAVLAKKLRGVDLIVGGHTHTPMCNLPLPGGRQPAGKYPMQTKDADGNPCLVVTAWEWGKLFGRIKVSFNAKGLITGFTDANSVVVDSTVAEDPFMKSTITALSQPILALRNTIIGQAPEGVANGNKSKGESPIGNLVADSMLAKTAQQGAQIAIMNAGGLRSNIEAGPVSFEAAISVQPFANTLILMDITGDEIRRSVELGAASPGFLHFSKGVKLVLDFKKPAGNRVVSMSLNGAEIEANKTYRVVTNSFLAGGGDSHTVLKESKGFRLDTGFVDVDALVEYIKAHSPIKAVAEGRIVSSGG